MLTECRVTRAKAATVVVLTKCRVARAKAATVVVLTKWKVTRAKAATVVVLTGNQPQQRLHVKCDPNTLHILYTTREQLVSHRYSVISSLRQTATLVCLSTRRTSAQLSDCLKLSSTLRPSTEQPYFRKDPLKGKNDFTRKKITRDKSTQ